MTSLNWLTHDVAKDPTVRRYFAETSIKWRKQRTPPKHEPGHVIEIIKKGKPLCAVIISTQHRKRHILDCNGKEWTLDLAKTINLPSIYIGISPPKHELLESHQEVYKLPPEKQDAIAALILEEIEDDHKWDKTFAKSQDKLAKIAQKVREDIKSGRKKWDSIKFNAQKRSTRSLPKRTRDHFTKQ